ncbi:MAG: type II secretion system major pseudopilin GspG [Gammaproteobacteria bacterium]|nr:type II secretion system major pseudopilin GspG [Gammaproteobacteria bacterium]
MRGQPLRTSRRNLTQRGFTLLELLVVIAIIAILGAVAANNLLPNVDKAKISAAKTDIQRLSAALDMYKLDNGDYPSIDQGLQSLVSAPAGAKNWQQGGYLTQKSLPKDPWDNDYQYVYPGENGVFDLYSLGSDKAPGGEGNAADLGNW